MTLRFGRVPCRAAAAIVALAAVTVVTPANGRQLVVEGETVLEIGDGPGGGVRTLPAEAVPDVTDDPWWHAAGPPRTGPRNPEPRQAAQARLAAIRRARGTLSLHRELSLVRAACPGLQPDVRSRVLAAGREAVEAQASGRSPLVGGVEAALERALSREAGPAAAAAYRAELAARGDRRQAAAIAVLVESIDRAALLDDRGRADLREALRENWRPEWEVVVSSGARPPGGPTSLPTGVADVAATTLDVETFTAWRRRLEEGR